MTDEATALVPGHVTGFFSVHRADDPVRTGSRGAGLALTHGVEVTVSEAAEPGVVLDGEPVAMEPVERVLDALGVEAAVDGTSQLPVGTGFGVSGAMALGAALAANRVFDLGRSENELVRLAHVAEVEAGTGLGDVVAQARGGVPIRLEPGAPPHGCLDGVPATGRIEYLAMGELPTADVLAGDTDRLSEAGERALSVLREQPTLPTLLSCSRRFAREAGLLTDDVRAVLERVDAAGGSAAMAMLGRTVFAPGTGLSDAGYEPSVCRIDQGGAALCD